MIRTSLYYHCKEHHCIIIVKWQQISFENWPWHRTVGWPLASYGKDASSIPGLSVRFVVDKMALGEAL